MLTSPKAKRNLYRHASYLISKSIRSHPVGSVNAIPHLCGCGNSQIQCLQYVVPEILSVLNTAADAHQVVKHTNGLALVFGDTSVGHAARYLD